jgi:hypothetical protein
MCDLRKQLRSLIQLLERNLLFIGEHPQKLRGGFGTVVTKNLLATMSCFTLFGAK